MTETPSTLASAYDSLTAAGLSLDLTRGKPSPAQLDLSSALLTLPGVEDYRDAAGTDLRNYGGPDGVLELRAIFGDLLGIPTEQLLALDSTSLPMMHETVVAALLRGVPGGTEAWRDVDGVTFL